MKIDIPPIYKVPFLKNHYLTIKKVNKNNPIYAFTPIIGFSKHIVTINPKYLELYANDNYILVDESLINAYTIYIQTISKKIENAKYKMRKYKPISIDYMKIYYNDLAILLRLLQRVDNTLYNILSKTPPQFFLTIEDIIDLRLNSLIIAEDQNEITTIRKIYHNDKNEWKKEIDQYLNANNRHCLPTNAKTDNFVNLDKNYINITPNYTRWLMSTVFVIEDYLMDIE